MPKKPFIPVVTIPDGKALFSPVRLLDYEKKSMLFEIRA